MKKEFLVAVSVLFGMAASLSVSAQEKLSLKQCREMALKYNKEMAAADKQTEAARLMSLSYKANFFPNFTASGTGLYSTADGSLGIQGGNLPVSGPSIQAEYKWNNRFIWAERFAPPIKCHCSARKWHI